MKRSIILLLCFVLTALLCACGAEQPAATQPAATQPVATEPAATEPAATEPAATEPAATEPATTGAAADPKALADSCVEKPVAELIALVGEPDSTEYAPSCLHPGEGEDGLWYYNGFVVYTYKEGDTETVTYVE